MLLDERNDVIHLLLRRLEAALSVLRDDELVATYPSALAVSTHIRRITQAIPLVQMITCVHQHFLYAQPVQKVIVCQLVRFPFFSHIVLLFCCPLLSMLSYIEPPFPKVLLSG